MDNCTVHHVAPVMDLFESAGVLHFLPHYSLDYNTIEKAFSYVKGYLKEHDDIHKLIDPITLLQAAFHSITKEQCNAWINHSGYSD